VDIAVGATIVAVAKKVLSFLLGSKKGRKFLLYVVGVALFIVCIPLITALGLFGWMAGDSGSLLNHEDILANIPNEQLVQMQTIDEVCNSIEIAFENAGLEESDHKKAKAIYIGYLVGMETQEGFYEDLAHCFLATTETSDVYDMISQNFLVIISEEDQTKFDDLYGVTSIMAITQTEEAQG
jgi:hypothetical protein